MGEIWEEDGDVLQAKTKLTCKKLFKWQKEDVRADPEWIKELITRNRPYSLPVFVNSELFEMIVSNFIEDQWTEPSLKLVDKLSSLILQTIHSQLSEDNKLQRFPKLLFFLKRKVEDVIDELTSATRKKVLHFIKSEKIPYSQDHYLFENITRMRSKYLKLELQRLIRASDKDGNIATKVALQIIQGSFERNQKKSVDDHMAEEMMHVLNAYGKVALKRFCDSIPMLCGEGQLHSFTDRINEVLSMITDEELGKLLSAPPDEQVRRQNLKRKLKTLERGMAAFDELF